MNRSDFETCFYNQSLAMALVGTDGKLQHVNRSLESLTYLDSDQLKQLRFLRVTRPEFRPLLMKNIDLLSHGLQNCVTTRCKLAIEALTDEWVDVDIEMLDGMPDEAKYLVSLIPFGRQNRRGLSPDHAISLVSHELRTPITALSGSLAMHKHKLGAHTVDQDLTELETMERSIEKIIKISEDILQYSEIESFAFSVRFQEFDILKELNRLCADFEAPANMAEMKIAARGSKSKIIVNLDCFRLGQAVSNFISNSLKYCPSGSRIEIFVEETSEDVVLTISDNGPGLPDDVQSRIFEAFNRSSQTVYTQPSTGLGLRIAKQLIIAMGGQIELTRTSVEGTIYTITFPTANQTRS